MISFNPCISTAARFSNQTRLESMLFGIKSTSNQPKITYNVYTVNCILVGHVLELCILSGMWR